MQGYDAWKLAGGEDPGAERLADLCHDIEGYLQARLEQVIESTGIGSSPEWHVDEIVTDVDHSDNILTEVRLRVTRIPGDTPQEALSELSECLADLGIRLGEMSEGKANGPSLCMRMAPSVRSRSVRERKAGAG
jgi:hypothetical protein